MSNNCKLISLEATFLVSKIPYQLDDFVKTAIDGMEKAGWIDDRKVIGYGVKSQQVGDLYEVAICVYLDK